MNDLWIYGLAVIVVIVIVLTAIYIYNQYFRKYDDDDDYEYEDEDDEEELVVKNVTRIRYENKDYRPYADKRGLWIPSYYGGILVYLLIPRDTLKQALEYTKERSNTDGN